MTELELERGSIELDGSIRASQELGGVTIVVLEQENRPNQVLGVDETGTILWEYTGSEGELGSEPETVRESTQEFVGLVDTEGTSYLISPRHGVLCRMSYDITIGDETIRFSQPVFSRISHEDLELIMLSPVSGTPSRNILAYETDGTQRWRIEAIENPHTDGYSTYTGLKLQDGKLFATSYHGWKVSIDPADGTITKEHRVK